jgi:hypothetical protein
MPCRQLLDISNVARRAGCDNVNANQDRDLQSGESSRKISDCCQNLKIHAGLPSLRPTNAMQGGGIGFRHFGTELWEMQRWLLSRNGFEGAAVSA